jgi:hypothetical protein
MANKITETTLEMHYHFAMMDLFRSTFGVGPTGRFSFFKYSIRKEKFLGFDQAYVQTTLSDQELFKDLADIAQGKQISPRYIGYFLQFKKVDQRIKVSPKIPPSVTAYSPFYGVKLSTQRDNKNNLSQHELLKNISSSSSGAFVYYACPLLFDKLELYARDADLDQIVLVEVNSGTPQLTDNKPHHIYFSSSTSTPVWCSDPVNGISTNMREMFSRLKSENSNPKVFANSLQNLFNDSHKFLGLDENKFDKNQLLSILSDILILIRIE